MYVDQQLLNLSQLVVIAYVDPFLYIVSCSPLGHQKKVFCSPLNPHTFSETIDIRDSFFSMWFNLLSFQHH